MCSNNMKGDLVLRDITNGEIFLLKSNVRTYVCGRGKNADIPSLSIMASREHCHFTRIRGELNVADWGSSNGIYINGEPQPTNTMIPLKINDLIGIGCPEVSPRSTTSKPSSSSNGRAVIPQIKTVYRLEFPSIRQPSKNAIPSNRVQQTKNVSPKNIHENQRLSKNSTDNQVPYKKPKVDEDIVAVIDLADDSDDGIPVENDGWNRPSTSSDPFSVANLSAIKVEAFDEISTSRERDSSSRRVRGSDTSLDIDNSPCDSTSDRIKSPGENNDRHKCKKKDSKVNERHSMKKLKLSTDTDSGEEDRSENKRKYPPIPTSPANNLRRNKNVTNSPDQDRRKEKVISSSMSTSPSNTRIQHSNVSASSFDSTKNKKKVTESRREDRGEEKLKSYEKGKNISLANAPANQSNIVASSNELLKHEEATSTRPPIIESSSEDEIDILKREDLRDLDDASSHSSWEHVEDFSIPGYNADEVQIPEEIKTVVASSDDAAFDQQFKYEPELNIVDNDESIYKDENCLSQSFTPTPLKLKRVVKQEPITEYSQHDFVELSDDEEDVFPASQLFGDDEGLEIEKKIKNENDLSDEENEQAIYDRRDCDSPVLIQLSDSEEEVEHNPWYDRLMRAEVNASRESLIPVRDPTKFADTPLFPSEEDIPRFPPPAELTSSFLATGVRVSSNEQDGPSSPPKANVPISPLAKKTSIFPAAEAPVSPNEHHVPSSPPEATIAEQGQPGSPTVDIEEEIYEACFLDDQTDDEEEEHGSEIDRAKSDEKRPKLTEEHTTKKVVQEKEKSRKDDSSSSKKKTHNHTKQTSSNTPSDSEHAEAKIRKKSSNTPTDSEHADAKIRKKSSNTPTDSEHAEAKIRKKSSNTPTDSEHAEAKIRKKSSNTPTDSEHAEGKIRKKSKDRKGEKSKQSSESATEKERDSTVEKSKSEVRATHPADSSSSTKKRVAPEEKTNVRTESPSYVEKNEARGCSSIEETSKQRAATSGQSRSDGVPVVLLTKVDHPRRSVPIVDAPIIGNNQRRGVSCQVINKSTSKPDDQRPSTSGLQSHETKRTKPSPPMERKLSAAERKELEYEKKALLKRRSMERRRRQQLHPWAKPMNARPVVATTPPAMSSAERKEIKNGRTKKLKLLAEQGNQSAEANAPPANRPAVKVKAKVTQKTRNDFLVDEFQDKVVKESTNAEGPAVDNANKMNDAKKRRDVSTDSRKQANVSDVTSNSEEQAANLKKQTVTYPEIPATNDYSFSSDNSEQENDPTSYQFESASRIDGKARKANGVQSPIGKEQTNESLDLIKERVPNYEIPLHNGANFYRENDYENEISSSYVEKENRDMSPNKMKRKNNSPDIGRKKARNGRDQINNEYVEKSTIHTGVSKAATTQNDRQWHDRTTGMRVLEETSLDCRRTLNNNIIHEKESTVASRDPRLQTGKPAKVKSLLKKPRRSIGSKPRVIKRVTFDDHNTKVQLFEIDPGNSLRKCDFKDSLLAIRQNSSTKSKGPVAVDCPKLEEFLLRIFEWNPVWLKEQKFMPGPPPVVKEKSLVRVKPRYESYEEYYAIFEPLMALELWYGISKDYDDREKERVTKNSCVFSVVENSVTRTTVPSTNINVTTLMIEIVVSKKEIRERTHPAFGDLIFFEYVSNIRAKQGGFQRWKVFAYVTKLHQCILTPRTIYNHDLVKYVPDPHMLLTLTVMTKPLNPAEMQTNTVNRLGTISYLRSNIRLIQALQSLPTSILSPMILNPKIEDYQLPPAGNLGFYPLVTKDKLNPKQLEAVMKVTEAVVQKLPKICLIQGPPGTGKSKVIVNMMMQILYGRGKNSNRRGMRILVCAPSNAAIDEIVLRLLEIRRTFEKGHRFNMVRIGRDHTMHPMVKEVSLTELAKKNVKATADSYKSPDFTPECIQEEKNRLEARKNSLELELATGRNLDPVRLKQLKNKLTDIEASYGLLMSGRSVEHLDEKESFKLQRGAENALLKGADVIACTLSSCYTEIMQSVFAETDATISVCIVDEATQSIEAETLVPLMLGVKTLVLVGDTNQLPATVLSQRAKGLGLDQSLFARIQRSLEGQGNNPIILLDTQYRMSYPVAYWPNKYFYAGAIKNSELLPNVASNLYKVINLDSTQDLNKFTNTNEANFVASLVYTIMARSTWDSSYQQVRIGIITPYNNQKTLITSKIKERTAMLSEKIKKKYIHEVNTVDSFQGQERDIIIMSCVRSNGIGFLSDRQRLCVALTRAKNSLILCGNFAAFKTNPMWNALITDAKSRSVFLDMRANAGTDEIMKNIFRQR